MRPFTKTRAPALFLGLALAGFAGAAVTAETTNAPAPLRCEIALDAVRGGTRIEGRVISATPVTGSYEMAITSRMGGGRATIRQSGEFAATPGTPALLAETEMFGAPANHSVDLSVRIGTRRLTCAEAL